MHGLILAGGDGSRLLASGVTVPKALVRIAGRPQVAPDGGCVPASWLRRR